MQRDLYAGLPTLRHEVKRQVQTAVMYRNHVWLKTCQVAAEVHAVAPSQVNRAAFKRVCERQRRLNAHGLRRIESL